MGNTQFINQVDLNGNLYDIKSTQDSVVRTTLADYNITDAYTKAEVDRLIDPLETQEHASQTYQEKGNYLTREDLDIFELNADLSSKQDKLNNSQLKAVNSGITNDLVTKFNVACSQIPSKTSDLTNDSGFITWTDVDEYTSSVSNTINNTVLPNIEELNEKTSSIYDQLQEEVSYAKEDRDSIKDSLTEEINRAVTKENLLDTTIALEIQRAKGEESRIEEEINSEIQGITRTLKTIQGFGEGSIKYAVEEILAKILDGAPDTFNTLKEVADWIETHDPIASDLIADTAANKQAIEDITERLKYIPSSPEAQDLTELINRIVTLETGDTELVNRIAALEAKEDANTVYDDSALTSRIDDIQSNLTALSENVARIPTSDNSEDITKIWETLDGNEGNIARINIGAKGFNALYAKYVMYIENNYAYFTYWCLDNGKIMKNDDGTYLIAANVKESVDSNNHYEPVLNYDDTNLTGDGKYKLTESSNYSWNIYRPNEEHNYTVGPVVVKSAMSIQQTADGVSMTLTKDEQFNAIIKATAEEYISEYGAPGTGDTLDKSLIEQSAEYIKHMLANYVCYRVDDKHLVPYYFIINKQDSSYLKGNAEGQNITYVISASYKDGNGEQTYVYAKYNPKTDTVSDTSHTRNTEVYEYDSEIVTKTMSTVLQTSELYNVKVEDMSGEYVTTSDFTQTAREINASITEAKRDAADAKTAAQAAQSTISVLSGQINMISALYVCKIINEKVYLGYYIGDQVNSNGKYYIVFKSNETDNKYYSLYDKAENTYGLNEPATDKEVSAELPSGFPSEGTQKLITLSSSDVLITPSQIKLTSDDGDEDTMASVISLNNNGIIEIGGENVQFKQGTKLTWENLDDQAKTNITPTIGEDGYWYIGGTKLEKATPEDPDVWSIEADGYWYFNGSKTDKFAQGKNGQAVIVSYAFIRSNTVVTDAPTGGSFTSPHPTTSGWSDGVPTGNEPVYMSSRCFTSDGLPPQQSTWSVPSLMCDTADIDICYNASTNKPSIPSSHGAQNDSNGWHDQATENDIWMAVSSKVGGAWTSWQIVKIKGETGAKGDQGEKGEKGDAGTSVTVTNTEIRYTLSSSGTAVPTIPSGQNDSDVWKESIAISQGKYLWTRTQTFFSDNPGTPATSYSVSYIANDGQKGDKGDKGDTGSSIKVTSEIEQFAITESGDSAPDIRNTDDGTKDYSGMIEQINASNSDYFFKGTYKVWKRFKYTYEDGGTGYGPWIYDEFISKMGSKTTYIGDDGIYAGTIAADNIYAGTNTSNKIFSDDGEFTGAVSASSFKVMSNNQPVMVFTTWGEATAKGGIADGKDFVNGKPAGITTTTPVLIVIDGDNNFFVLNPLQLNNNSSGALTITNYGVAPGNSISLYSPTDSSIDSPTLYWDSTLKSLVNQALWKKMNSGSNTYYIEKESIKSGDQYYFIYETDAQLKSGKVYAWTMFNVVNGIQTEPTGQSGSYIGDNQVESNDKNYFVTVQRKYSQSTGLDSIIRDAISKAEQQTSQTGSWISSGVYVTSDSNFGNIVVYKGAKVVFITG